MKKVLVFLLAFALILVAAGCNANIENNINEYQNIETKTPVETTAFPNAENTGGDVEDYPGNTGDIDNIKPTDESGNALENTNGETYLPFPTNTPSASGSGVSTPVSSNVATSSPSIESTQSATATPSASSESQSTLKPSSTNKPDITPTKAPVITQGPEHYFILTVDNGGGGGYVYINQGQDGATNINKGWYNANDYVSISAVAYDGCTFEGWYVGEDFVSPYADYSFYMPARDYPLTARFVF